MKDFYKMILEYPKYIAVTDSTVATKVTTTLCDIQYHQSSQLEFESNISYHIPVGASVLYGSV